MPVGSSPRARSPPACRPSASRAQEEEEEESERRVKMRDLPAAVQQTVREQSQGARLRGLSRETEGGKTFYEAELLVAGHTKDVLMDETGAVVEVEEQVALASLPEAARAEIKRQAGGAGIGVVESITKGGAITAYEAHVSGAGRRREIKVSPEGKLLAEEKD
ncbi:MAG: hypothetical protein ABR563_13890 [Pyrinomonadaceae bacterium]